MCVGAVKNRFAVLDCNEQKETIILRVREKRESKRDRERECKSDR